MKVLLFDFSRTLLFSKDPTDQRPLNDQHRALSQQANYQPLDYFELNQELLAFVHQLKDKVKLYIFTSGTMVDSVPEIQQQLVDFEKIYSGKELGLDKTLPASYIYLAKEMGFSPAEILFIDDEYRNIIAAKQAGMSVIQHQTNQATMAEITKLMTS